MVQDAVLLETTQHELRHIVSRRKRKLQEVYQVTCAAADAIRRFSNAFSTSTDASTASETDFVEANDIEKGRLFDISTLRPLPGASPLFHPNNGSGSHATTITVLPQQTDAHTSSNRQEPVEQATSKSSPHLESKDASSNTADASGTALSRVDTARQHKESQSPAVPKPSEEGKHATVPRDSKGIGLAGRKSGLASPPADGADVTDRAPEDAKAHANRHQQPSFGGPESQLLFETARSQTNPTGLPSPSNANDEATEESKETVSDQVSTTSKSVGKGSDSQEPQNDSAKPANGVERQPKSGPKHPMQIDTTIAQQPLHNAISSATPGQTSTPERMRTRVSSGAIRHKSVSEILGETPRSASHERTPSNDKMAMSPLTASPASRGYSQTDGSAQTSTFNRRLSDLRDKDKARSQLSTVVFTKSQAEQEASPRNAAAVRRSPYDGIDDYLLPLFLAQASGHQELMQLINTSRKSLSTGDFQLHIRELLNCRLLKKIYVMQHNGKWSLRQHEREAEPERPATHWDSLLAEMKWMRTDFREERKWKLAMSRNLALACAQWVAAGSSDREAMQVKVKPPKYLESAGDITPESVHGLADVKEEMPDLVSSNDDTTSEEADEEMMTTPPHLPPAAVFSLGPDDLAFGMDRTPIGEKLLTELPLYDPFATLDRQTHGTLNEGIDGAWRRPLTIVSRWNDSRLVYEDESPRKKRKVSRYDYAADPEPEENHHALPVEKTDVAMFRPENRPLMHRLHQTHAFRMPAGNEHPLPSQSFFESRQSSQWTREDDELLRRRVREYTFNWSLISQTMSSYSQYSSGADRRTPWECFERWEAIEGIPHEYAKHDFFKHWQSRKQHAEQKQEDAYQAQQQAAATAPHLQPRKRTGKPVSIERRKNNRYLGLFMAMSKHAKKKEAQQAKQQQMASVAATRMQNETSQSQSSKRMTTPAEFSAYKHKQELDVIERQRNWRAQAPHQMYNPRNMPVHHGKTSNVPQMGRAGAPMNGAYPQLPSSMSSSTTNGQSRLLPPGQGMMTGMMANGARAGGMPHGQMPAYRQGHVNGTDNARVMAEAGRMQEQQRILAQNRQFSQNANNANSHAVKANMQMQNTFANMPQQAGKLGPAVNGQRPVSSSPRVPNVMAGQQLSSGITPAINHITSELKKRNPHLTDAQIQILATQQLGILANSRAAANNNMHAKVHGQQQQRPGQGSPQSVPSSSGSQNAGGNAGFSSQMNVSAITAYSNAMRMQTQQQGNVQSNHQQRPGSVNGSMGVTQNGATKPDSRVTNAATQNNRPPTSAGTPTMSAALPTATAASQSPRPPSSHAQAQAQTQGPASAQAQASAQPLAQPQAATPQ